jgi:hypothetical protein
MSVLTATESVVSFLDQAKGPVIVQDPQGNVLGYYTPESRVRGPKDGKSHYTLREVFQHLQTLTLNPEMLADLQRHIEEMNTRDNECDTNRSL